MKEGLWAGRQAGRQAGTSRGTVLDSDPSPVPSLPTGLFLGLTCEEVSDLSMEQAKGLAMAVRQKNITLQGHQVSPPLWSPPIL